MSSTTNKRIRPLSPERKLNAIKRVHQGETKAAVARDIGVPESTLRDEYSEEHHVENSHSQNTIKETSNSSEREKNNPDIFLSNLNYGSDSSLSNLLGAQWNALLLQQLKSLQPNKSNNDLNSVCINTDYTTNNLQSLPKDVDSWHLLNNQQSVLKSNEPSTEKTKIGSKPIFYQQRTSKEEKLNEDNAENLCIRDNEKTTGVRIKSVLDNLLLNKDNLPTEKNSLSQVEAIQHGEKFLKWLEAYSDPSVTAIQIVQFETLLNNVKRGVDGKKYDLTYKTKGKRK